MGFSLFRPAHVSSGGTGGIVSSSTWSFSWGGDCGQTRNPPPVQQEAPYTWRLEAIPSSQDSVQCQPCVSHWITRVAWPTGPYIHVQEGERCSIFMLVRSVNVLRYHRRWHWGGWTTAKTKVTKWRHRLGWQIDCLRSLEQGGGTTFPFWIRPSPVALVSKSLSVMPLVLWSYQQEGSLWGALEAFACRLLQWTGFKFLFIPSQHRWFWQGSRKWRSNNIPHIYHQLWERII